MKQILNNGLTIMINKNNSNAVTIKYVIKASSLDETNKIGTAHFTKHIILKGNTINRTAGQTNNDIAKLGATANAYTMHGYTAYYISAPINNWKKCLDILTDMVF